MLFTAHKHWTSLHEGVALSKHKLGGKVYMYSKSNTADYVPTLYLSIPALSTCKHKLYKPMYMYVDITCFLSMSVCILPLLCVYVYLT